MARLLLESGTRFSYNILRNSINHPYRHYHWSAKTEKKDFDLVVVGGGIIGVASAREIIMRHPSLTVAILEKEKRLAYHQSGHNSGVIHAGIYYKPGSLKAKLCVEGMQLAYKYLNENNIPHKKCGKVIVATSNSEVKALMKLHNNGLENNVPDLKLLNSPAALAEIEPFCSGVKAIWSPNTGIVDWALVTEYYAKDFQSLGGVVFLDFEANSFTPSTDVGAADFPITIRSTQNDRYVRAKNVLTCGGLQSDILAEKTGCQRSPRIVPFRGEYKLLLPNRAYLVKGNIYPVPDPNFPFLGVHFTPRMDGSISIGPNAVPAFKREGYKWSDISLFESFDAINYPGFRKFARKHFKFGLKEIIDSMFFMQQVKYLQKYIPDITEYDICKGPTGVRAQAVDDDGNLVDDFIFDQSTGDNSLSKLVLHCRNAPSPAATSSLAIANVVANKVEYTFKI